MSLRKNQTICLVSILLLTGFLITSFASYFVSRASLREEIEHNTLPLTSDNIYSEIQRDLLRPIFISSLMASDTFLRDWVIRGEKDPRELTRYLKQIQTKYGTFTSFFVSEKTRIYYHADGILKKVRRDEPRDAWYFRVRTMPSDHEINVDPDMANKDTMTIFINFKVFDYRGNYIGATGVGLAVTAVKTLIEDYQKRYSRDIFFVDRQGNVALSSSTFSGKGRRLADMPGLSDLAEKIIGANHLVLKYTRDGKTVHLNTRYIKEFDWFLLVEQTEDEAIRQIFTALLINLGICSLIMVIVLFVTNRSLTNYQKKLEVIAATDKLTGAFNRNLFDSLFNQATSDCQRRGEALSMLLFDLDDFKMVNDTFGHHAGDTVLQEVSRLVGTVIRESDLFFRWGGEEFMVLLKACDLENAQRIAETLRAQIESLPLHHDQHEIRITASFGVAQHTLHEEKSRFIHRADQALYVAKSKGRNRLELSHSLSIERSGGEALTEKSP